MAIQSRLTGILILLVSLTATLWGMGLGLGLFIHIPSILLVVGIVVGGLLTAFGPQRLTRAFKTLGANPVPPNHELLRECDSILRAGAHLAWTAAAIGMIAVVIDTAWGIIGGQLEPGAALPMALGLSHPLLYGAIIAELGFRVLKMGLCAVPAESRATPDTRQSSQEAMPQNISQASSPSSAARMPSSGKAHGMDALAIGRMLQQRSRRR